MKRNIIINSIIILGLILLISFTPNLDVPDKHDNEKKYSVSLTRNEWERYLYTIEFSKNALKASDLPSKVSFPLIDSLAKIQSEIKVQVLSQIQLDSTATKKK